ncbi:uncharacterized protein MYCFIDRAFT_83816 [Pseudocercospora fijiensis CIRAD86]|uniref:F-box domain-containing protein n=1 Tax=Pseudocercospora fijiensis (strain CIRAD86) TaxID=383855 RepID=M2ZIA7_PSEFD|nr:uncharacterized protein MYCFIDRAFT_83816 [Pseudocercospora fijiensis CIRAD86]EME78834.1 hypothetical protein MYCFIDRAFT_83816 [Pseudocercospora fijiensis CIRAD86]
MDHIHAFSPLGPPLIGAHSHQIPMHNRRRSSIVAGLDIEEFRQAKARRQCITNIKCESRAEEESEPKKSTVPSPNPQLQTSKQTSPFLTLPAELRNKIYTSLFESSGPPLIKPTYTLPNLLWSNRQIFSEAIGLYYTTSPPFRCLDETSTISWLTTLPKQFLDAIPEIRYDTRWIIFVTPLIPVPGAEGWLFRALIEKLEGRGVGVCERGLVGRRNEVGEWREGKLKISYYSKRLGCKENGIFWTDKVGLVESVTG